MVQQLVFHLFRRYLLAASVDLILLPAHHRQVAILVLHHQIPGAVEAIAIKHPGVVSRALVVTAEGIGTAGVQGARLAGGDRVARLIEDAHLVVRAHGAALGVNDLLVGVVQPGVVDQPLRHAEHLLQPAAEQRGDLARHRFGQLGAAHLQQVEALKLTADGRIRFGRLQPEGDRRRHQGAEVDLVAGDQRETADGAGILRQHHGAARLEHPQCPGGTQGEVVGGRQGAQITGMGPQLTDLIAAAHAVEIVVVSTGNELGGAGAATGELEEGYFVRRSRAMDGDGQFFAPGQITQPVSQPQLPRVAIQQHQLGAYA
ncbi:hypothetical protein D3C77_306080 [compost metagenome]